MRIFLDLETTGVEENDRLCAAGMLLEMPKGIDTFHELISPSKKIPPEASALHHITNEMVAEAPSFEQSRFAKVLAEVNSVENILVGHNLAFDLKMLAREGVTWQGGMIDTFKCVKHLLGSEIDRFALQYLRYELRLYRGEREAAEALGIALMPHHALSDAFHAMLLFRYLLEMADEEQLMLLTTEHALVHKLTFGKYGGKYIEDVARRDPSYLEWMLSSLPDLDEDLRHSVAYYLNEVRT